MSRSTPKAKTHCHYVAVGTFFHPFAFWQYTLNTYERNEKALQIGNRQAAVQTLFYKRVITGRGARCNPTNHDQTIHKHPLPITDQRGYESTYIKTKVEFTLLEVQTSSR